MGKIIAISNQKGGCSKTTTSINLAAGLSAVGKKVLLVDYDPQASLTKANQIKINSMTPTAYNFTMDHMDARLKITENIDIIPTNIKLSCLQNELISFPDGTLFLSYALGDLKEKYDFIIIDCPPQTSLLANNCYAAADEIIVPVFPGSYSVDGLVLLKGQIDKVKKLFNPSLKVSGILIANVDSNTRAAVRIKELAAECSEKFESKCFETVIPHSTVVNDAQTVHKSLLDFNKAAKVTLAYQSFVKEYLKGAEESEC